MHGTFADTVAAKQYKSSKDSHGWVGLQRILALEPERSKLVPFEGD